MGPTAPRAHVVLASLVVLLGAAQLAYVAASFSEHPLTIDIGPSTSRYLEGFTESEERVPVTFRWTRERASITLPLVGYGADAQLELRLARFLDRHARVRLFVDGEPQGSFSARSGRFRTFTLPLRLDGTRPTIALLVDDPEPERLGVAVDWVRIVNARWSLPAGTALLLVAGMFLLTVALGFSVPRAFGLGLGIAALQSLWLRRDPFAMAHVHDELTTTALFFTALVAFVVLMTRSSRTLPLLFFCGYVLKGALLFNPGYWYPDVRLHRRYVEVFRDADGSIVERGIEAQIGSNTAYPRKLAGRNYVLPYSPLFYMPFAALDRDARGIESSMKHTGLVLAAAELLAIYGLAAVLFNPSTALWACAVSLFLPPVTSRLLFAQWPTLFGHLLDVIAIGFGARLLKRAGSARALLGYGGAVFAGFLSYISSLFNLSLFTAALALVDRRRSVRLLVLGGAAGLVTLILLYLPFLRLLFGEILPNAFAGGGGAEALGLSGALGHVYLFYGVGFPALAAAGFLTARHRPPAFRLLVAYAAAFTTLIVLRAVSGAFKDLKELVFMGPWIAITVGVSLETLAARGNGGRLASIAVTIGLVGFALAKFGEYAALHTRFAGLD